MPTTAFAAALATSHLEIRRLAAAAATAPSLADAERFVRELAEALPRHLDEEEGPDGLLARLRAAGAPDRVLGRLRREHEAFRAQSPTLLGEVQRRSPTAEAQLEAFLRRLVQHEWVETAAWTSAHRGATGASRRSESEAEAIDALAGVVLGHARSRGARPATVEIGAPGDADARGELAAALELRLGELGYDFVEVVARGDGPPGVLAVRFEG